MSELTIKLPESLLISAHHAAEGSQKSLQSFVLEMICISTPPADESAGYITAPHKWGF